MSKETNYMLIAHSALEVVEEEGQEIYEFFTKVDAAVILMDLYCAADNPLGIEEHFDGNMTIQMNDDVILFGHQGVWGNAWAEHPIVKYDSLKSDMQILLRTLQSAMVEWMNKMQGDREPQRG